jgi:hypothetical protein
MSSNGEVIVQQIYKSSPVSCLVSHCSFLTFPFSPVITPSSPSRTIRGLSEISHSLHLFDSKLSPLSHSSTLPLFPFLSHIFIPFGCTLSTSASLRVYGDCAPYIRPLKSRKYIKDMLTCISVGMEGKEEGIFETIAVMLERVCPTLIFYLREREVQGIIELFRFGERLPSHYFSIFEDLQR